MKDVLFGQRKMLIVDFRLSVSLVKAIKIILIIFEQDFYK